jgi:hypothetical protein
MITHKRNEFRLKKLKSGKTLLKRSNETKYIWLMRYMGSDPKGFLPEDYDKAFMDLKFRAKWKIPYEL